MNNPVFIDITKYAGLWYEVYSIPQWFQKGCTNSQAIYTPTTLPFTNEVAIHVKNSCITKNGIKEVEGIAIPVYPVKNNITLGVFQVQFSVWNWLFNLFQKSNYWIYYVNKDYTLAVVSDKNKKTLWVLSRTPNLSKNILENLLFELKKNGFDVKNI